MSFQNEWMKKYTINLYHLKSRVGKAEQETIFFFKKKVDRWLELLISSHYIWKTNWQNFLVTSMHVAFLGRIIKFCIYSILEHKVLKLMWLGIFLKTY